MSTAPTNKASSTDTSGSVTRPESTDPSYSEGAVPNFSQLIGDFLLTSYSFPTDGSSGIALTNGEVAFHIDNQNNMIFSAGAPSQSGCGGKSVFNTESHIQKTGSISIEVSGRADDGNLKQEKNSEGNIEKTTIPAYSLKIYGDCLIECVGGDVSIKGDNITLNASNTLNLTSGKDVNIQAGVNGGNINLNGGTITMDSSFLKKKVSGGEYTDGAGEVQTDQYLPGSSVSYSSPGSVNYTILGDYTVGTTGDYKLGVGGNYNIDVTKDFAVRVLKDRSEQTVGKQKTEVQGITSEKAAQIENWKVIVGPGKGSKEIPAFSLESGGGITLKSLLGGIKNEVGPKAPISSFSIDEKEITMTAGVKLGTLTMGPKGVDLNYTEASSIKMAAGTLNITSPAIFLN